METKQMKHTPGPWIIDNNEGYQCTIGSEYAFASSYPANHEHRRICDVRGPSSQWKSPSEETKSNAFLISAAPDLLFAAQLGECLAKVILKRFGDMPDTQKTLNTIQQAIAKAEGRT